MQSSRFPSPHHIYPSHISWRVNVENVQNLGEIIGHKTAKKLKRSSELLTSHDYHFTAHPVTPEFLDVFAQKYIKHISALKRGTIFNVKDKISANQHRGAIYESISLWKKEQLIGSLIYSVRQNSLNVAYRIFPHRLNIKLPLSSSYLAENHLIRRAVSFNKTLIIHGRDRNIFGHNSAIGLASYKLRVGAMPFISKWKGNTFHPLHQLPTDKDDILVFLGSHLSQTITQAVLITEKSEEEAREQYKSLFNHHTVTTRYIKLAEATAVRH